MLNKLYLPTNTLDLKKSWLIFGLTVAISILIVFSICWKYKVFSFILFGLLGIIFLLPNFRLWIYSLLVCFFLPFHLLPRSGIVLADLVIVVLILSYLCRGAMIGEFSLRKTPLDRSILLFLLVLGLSLVNAFDIQAGIRYFVRHIQLFILFYILSTCLQWKEINNLLKFFLALTAINSIYAIIQFISSRGFERSFGLAGIPFNNILVAALLICFCFFLFEDRTRGKIKYWVIFFTLFTALIATQTRSALIYFLLGYVSLAILGLTKARKLRIDYLRKNLFKLTLTMVLVGLILIISFPIISKGYSHRFLSIHEFEVGTIQLRFILWGMALKSFLYHPVLGIGLGQFPNIYYILPEVRFHPLYIYVSGMTAHGLTFSYLAETGILGIIFLYYFIFSFLRLTWRNYKKSVSKEDLFLSLCLLGALVFGEWTFISVNGMQFMLFLALNVVFSRKVLITQNGSELK